MSTCTPTPLSSFASFNFPESLCHTLAHMKYDNPTPIQAKAIPLIGQGHDIIGCAQTGTGKTGAFAIPLIAKLLNSSEDSVLVLTPTRELASQVLSIFHQLLGKRSKINTALLIGGDPIIKQIRQLQQAPRVIVGTPGRVNDHILRRNLKLHEIKYLVLDETDRMLDMGFDVQIEAIIERLSPSRQTLMFSATIANRIATLAKRYLNNPERVDCGTNNAPAPKIKQENIHTSEKGKYNILTQELDKREGSVIVFVKTKRDADELASRLRGNDHRADAIHGDLQQRRRERVISDFRQKRYRIMVATDVASRGLDIPHIEHVINFNLPHCPEDYIHRIGRTARAGAEGSALNLISPEDDKKWRAIHRLLNPGSHSNDRDRHQGSSRGGAPHHRRGGQNGGQYQSRQRERGPFAGYGANDQGRRPGPRSDERSPSRYGERNAPRGGGERGEQRYGERTAAPRGGDRYAPRTGERAAPRTGDRYAPRTGERGAPRAGDRNGPRGSAPTVSYANADNKRKKYGSSNGESNLRGSDRKSAPYFPNAQKKPFHAAGKKFERAEKREA